MSQIQETRNSVDYKFTTIPFSEADASKSKTQVITDYLNNVEQNKNTYKKSSMYVSGIFSQLVN